MAEGKWVQIDPGRDLFIGDEVRLHFLVTGPTYVVAAQIAVIEKKIEKDDRFIMLRHSIPKRDHPSQLTDFFVDVKVIKSIYVTHLVAGGVITVAAIAAVIVGAFWGISAAISVSLHYAESFVRAYGEAGEHITETIKETGWSAMKIAAAAIIGFVAIKWIK